MLKLLTLAALLAATAAAPGDYPNIIGLRPTGNTLNSVTLSWTLNVSEFIPIKYTLVVDGILTMQFFHDGTDTYTASGLQSCKEYTFDLTADYNGGSGETAGTLGRTVYETPGAIGDLTVSGSIVSWTAPTNARCVDHYRVCYVSAVTEDNTCTEGVLTTSYDLGVLSACEELDVTVSAVNGDITGEASTVHVSTPDGVPGKPRDVEVVALTESTVLLAWNRPLENPACVQDYALVFGPIPDEREVLKTEDDEDDEDEEGMAEGPSGQTETAVLDNLLPCTDYRFGVSAVSNSNEHSDEVVVYLSTNETAPGKLPDIEFDPSEDSITISWGDVSEEACLNVIQICYLEPDEHTLVCVEVPSSPNTWTVSGLGACRDYRFSITGLSPDGLTGEPIVITVPTLDRAPGAVQNLALERIEMTSVSVTYDPPLDYPECVDQYVVTYKNVLDVLDTRSAITRVGSFVTNIDGLDACATYDIGVSAVSRTAIEGPVRHIGTSLKQGTPDPPSDGMLLGSTDTSLTVLWFAPTDTKFCVDMYEVKLTRAGSEHTQLVPELQFSQEILETFTDLDPCSFYDVQIRSGNSETSAHSPYATVVNNAETLCP